MGIMTIDDTSLGGQAFLPVSTGVMEASLSNMKDLALLAGVTIEGVDTAPATGLIAINLDHVMVFSLDKDEFVSKIQFEDPSEDNDNTALAPIALSSAADTFTYRGIRSALVELPAVDLQQGDFLKVKRYSKSADGSLTVSNGDDPAFDFPGSDPQLGYNQLVANMTAALNAQVCQLKDMVNTYDSTTAGTDDLKVLADAASSADQKALSVDALRDMASPYAPDVVGPPNGNAGQVADAVGRSYGDVLTPAVSLKAAIGDLKEAILTPANVTTYTTEQTYNLYYNVRLVDNNGTELTGTFQSNIEPKFDQKSKVQIHARWISNMDMMPNNNDGVTDHVASGWPGPSGGPGVHLTNAAHSASGATPAPTIQSGGFDGESSDVLQAVSNSLGRFYGRIEWAQSPVVNSASLTKEAVNALVAGLIDVSGVGPKSDQIVEIQNAMTAEITAGNFKGLTSDTTDQLNANLSSKINIMGWNNGPSNGHTEGGQTYSQVHQTCIAFSDSLP